MLPYKNLEYNLDEIININISINLIFREKIIVKYLFYRLYLIRINIQKINIQME